VSSGVDMDGGLLASRRMTFLMVGSSLVAGSVAVMVLYLPISPAFTMPYRVAAVASILIILRVVQTLIARNDDAIEGSTKKDGRA